MSVYFRVDLDAAAAAVGVAKVPALVQDMVRTAPIDGLFFDQPGSLGTAGHRRVGPYPWTVREAREAVDPAALDAQGRLALAACAGGGLAAVGADGGGAGAAGTAARRAWPVGPGRRFTSRAAAA